MQINLVMIIQNEARCLERCIRAALPFVDKIIVTDTGSTDGSLEILSRLSQDLLEKPLYYDSFTWQDDFSLARNHALQCSEERGAAYHLVVDADELLLGIFQNFTKDGKPSPPLAADGRGFRQYMEGMERKHGRQWIGMLGRYDPFPAAQAGAKERPSGRSHSSGQDGSDGKPSGGNHPAPGAGMETGFGYYPRILPRGIRYTGRIHEQPDSAFPRCLSPLKAWHDGYLGGQEKGIRNLAYLEAAAKEEPDNPYYQYQLAVTLRNLGRAGESLPHFRAFDRLLREGGGMQAEYRNQGICAYLYALMDQGGRDALEEGKHLLDRERGQAAFSEDADFHFACGLFYMRYILTDTARHVSLLPEIERSFLRCLAIGEGKRLDGVVGTGSFKAAYNLGLWYELNQQLPLALKYYQMAADAGYAPAQEALARAVKGFA